MIDPWILSFSILTVAATIWMGFRSARSSKSASDFFVAGRSVSVGWNASAISGEYLSAASFMGVAGMVMSAGYDALWYPVCYACGYLFLLLFIAGPLRRFGAYTIPDFAEGRYDSPVFRRIAVIFVLFIGFFYTMPQMKGAGTTLAYVFKDISFFGQKGLPYWVGVVVVGAVITLNVALGGMKGITLIQAFQYWIKMFAISVPIFVLASVYGGYGGQLERNEQRREIPLLKAFNMSATPEVYKIVPTDRAAEFGVEFRDVTALGRVAPLPAKAPTDEAWLNPFGPLTTKAAKAAVPKVSYPGEFDLVTEDVGEATALNAAKDGFRKRNRMPSDALDYSTAQRPFLNLETKDVLLEYARRMTLASHLGLSTTLRLDLSRSLAAPAFFNIRVAATNYSPAQALALFQTNGITVVRESGNVFRALPTREVITVPVNARPFALLYTYSLIIALVCGTAGLPHILVRFYTNPDGVAAKRTTMWVMILIGIFYVFPPIFGAMGRNLMPSLYEGAGVNGTDGIVLKLPTVLADRFGVLGSILSGITCAGAFAAFMSTFSGLLVSMTGALAHDVYGRILRPKSTPAERLRMFKIAAVLIGAVAILLGTLVENFEINFMVGQAFAIAAASYFPLLFMSVWWQGMTVRGAASGMLTGGLLAVAAISLTSWTTFLTTQAAKFKALGQAEPGWFAGLKPYSLSGFWADHPLLRILGEQPAIWAVPLAITMMIVVSKLTHRSVPSDIRKKMLVLHAPEALGLRQDYIRDHEAGH